MAVASHEELAAHIGHEIECVGYGERLAPDGKPVNVAVECMDCGVVLIDFDREEPNE